MERNDRSASAIRHGRAVLWALLFWCGSSNAQSIAGPPSLKVDGHASLQVVPDLFPVELTLAETSTDVATTQTAIESLSAKIVGIARDMKLPDADFSADGLKVAPETDYNEGAGTQKFIGNTYSRVFHVRFHRIEDLLGFLQKLPSAKQLQVQTRSFTYSGLTDIRARLLTDAIRNARESGDAMAKAVGKTIVGVHLVESGVTRVSYSGGNAWVGNTANTGGSQGPLLPAVARMSAGVIDIGQDVTLIFVLSN